MSVETLCPKKDKWINVKDCDCKSIKETAFYHSVDFDGIRSYEEC